MSEIHVEDDSNTHTTYHATDFRYTANGNVAVLYNGVERETMFDDKPNDHTDRIQIPVHRILRVIP